MIVERAQAAAPGTRSYLAALTASRSALLEGGPDAVAAALARRGWAETPARAGAHGILEPGGLVPERTDLVAGVQASMDLRARYTPGWRPAGAAADYVADCTADHTATLTGSTSEGDSDA